MSTDPLRDRFDRFDLDGNGTISEAELAQLLDALGVGYTEIQVRATFTSLDGDGSGQIEFEEFRAWWQSC
jgi:calcium-binding protein CML